MHFIPRETNLKLRLFVFFIAITLLATTIDLLAALPEVNAKRIGCVGNSGGGTLTAYIAALDPRVHAAVPSCYITTLPRRMGNRIDQDPDADPEQDVFDFVGAGIDHAGLLALRVPRPTLIGTAVRDFFPVEGARESFDEAKRLYEVAGAADRVSKVEADERHGLSLKLREGAYAWFDRWLLGREGPRAGEVKVTPRPAKELLVCADGQVNVTHRSRPLLPLALEAFRAQKERPRVALKDLLGLDPDAADFALSATAAKGGPELPHVVCVNGVEAPDWQTETAFLAAMGKAGFGVTVVDPRGVGTLRPAGLDVKGHAYADPLCGVEENIAYNAFLVGKCLLGMRVADVLKALAQVRAGTQAAKFVLCARKDAALKALEECDECRRLGPAGVYLAGRVYRDLALPDRMAALYDAGTDGVRGPLAVRMMFDAAAWYDLSDQTERARRRYRAVAATDQKGYGLRAELALADMRLREGATDDCLRRCREREQFLRHARLRQRPATTRFRRRRRIEQLRLASLFHELLRAHQRRQMLRDSIERRRARVPRAVLLRVFDLVPVRPDLVHILHLHIAKNVRMPPDQLLDEVPRHALEIDLRPLAHRSAVERGHAVLRHDEVDVAARTGGFRLDARDQLADDVHLGFAHAAGGQGGGAEADATWVGRIFIAGDGITVDDNPCNIQYAGGLITAQTCAINAFNGGAIEID